MSGKTENKAPKKEKKPAFQISAPNMQVEQFRLVGDAPLVIHRFSKKEKDRILEKMKKGSRAKQGKKREPFDEDGAYNDARYHAAAGWDGVNAGAFRAAMISACRLVGFKMTVAKLAIFVVNDGWDEKEPYIPLVRIDGKPEKLTATARTETGVAYINVRPMYREWRMKLTVKYDGDLFSSDDIRNLLERVGQQVGIGEGRPDSKKSTGMGWGTFTVARDSD